MLTEAALAQLNEIARTWDTNLVVLTRLERADAAMRLLPDLLAELAALRERALTAEEDARTAWLRVDEAAERVERAEADLAACRATIEQRDLLLAAAVSTRDEARAENERLRDALEHIAIFIDCYGLQCPYCDTEDQKHPPSTEARIALAALARPGANKGGERC